MGDYAEMMLDGTMCSSCGVYIGEATGEPAECETCAVEIRQMEKSIQRQANIARNARMKKTRCPECNKKVKEIGLNQHRKDVHGVEQWIR